MECKWCDTIMDKVRFPMYKNWPNPIFTGKYQCRHQCPRCGCLEGRSIKHPPNMSKLPLFSKDKQEAFSEIRNRIGTDIYNRKFRSQGSIQYANNYADYLASEHWQQLRKAAIERTKGRCIPCFCRERYTPATQVHHITYQNLGNENPWELLPVCRKCHEGIHAIGDGQ